MFQYRKRQFYRLLAQTSEISLGFDLVRASGHHLYDSADRPFLDFTSGFSVCNIAYGLSDVISAVNEQTRLFLHTTVYGKHLQNPQIELAKRLVDLTAGSLDLVYFLSSGSEAVEFSIKTVKAFTRRPYVAVAKNGYHGSTLLCESLRSDRDHQRQFRPLLPGVRHFRFGEMDDLGLIREDCAAVLLEPVQTEAGIRVADLLYFQALRRRCHDVGALLIFDEIQTGIGRTGSLFLLRTVRYMSGHAAFCQGAWGGNATFRLSF